MKELESKALQEYLQNAITLETDVATQEEIISQYALTANEKKPQCVLREEPPKKENFVFVGFFLVILSAGGALLFASLASGGGFFSTLWWILAGIAALFVVMSFWLECSSIKEVIDHQKQSKMVEEENKIINQRYSQDMKTWEKTKNEMNAFMAKPLAKTRQILEAYYSQDVIYPKYRNLPALTSIYEYLITGRCEGLTGPYGAYNIYEDEVRRDMIISQLSAVIQNLEKIKQNQYLLYGEVQKIQLTTSRIEDELRQMKEDSSQIASLTALNAYYSDLNVRNTRIMMRYHL